MIMRKIEMLPNIAPEQYDRVLMAHGTIYFKAVCPPFTDHDSFYVCASGKVWQISAEDSCE